MVVDKNLLWSFAIVEELQRSGIFFVCISPGLRSLPLVTAFAKSSMTKVVHVDERGLAFCAMGLSNKESPAAIITTSGTAVANMLPAVIEAYMSTIPMVVITADRPSELIDVGSNQSINQHEIFSPYLKWKASIPCPSGDISIQYVTTAISHAVFRSKNFPQGPVHINIPFREPLVSEKNIPKYHKAPQGTQFFANCSFSFPSKAQEILFNDDIVIIVAGKMKNENDSEKLLQFAENFKIPIFADITSHLRTRNSPWVANYCEWILDDKNLQRAKTIIQFGDSLVSKSLLKFIDGVDVKNYIIVVEEFARRNPSCKASMHIAADIGEICSSSFVKNMPCNCKSQREIFAETLKEISDNVGKIVAKRIETKGFCEESIVRDISKFAPDNMEIFLGNSLSIRLMNKFAVSTRECCQQFFANRGASGIDGNIATAIGMAIRSSKPFVLVIGDLSFIHDINSLLLLKNVCETFVIVILNNGGGKIFSTVNTVDDYDIKEKFIESKHSMEFSKFAEWAGIEYKLIVDRGQFRDEFLISIKQKCGIILEANFFL